MTILCLFLFLTVFMTATADVTEGFNNNNSNWYGENFKIENSQLTLKAEPQSGKASFSTENDFYDNSQWYIKLKLRFNPSAANNLKFYLTADNRDLKENLNGFYIQIGNANDQILLYSQSGNKATKIGEGIKKRLDRDSIEIEIIAEKNIDENWIISSKYIEEPEFTEEFTVEDKKFEPKNFFGILCTYSKKNSDNAFFIDSIAALSEKAEDKTPPKLSNHTLKNDTLILIFTEDIKDFFIIDENEDFEIIFKNLNKIILHRKNSNIYKLRLYDIKDYSGNKIADTTIYFAENVTIDKNDVIINEIMFNPPAGGCDFVEIYNNSKKIINLKQLKIATRKENGNITQTANLKSFLLFPEKYAVITTSKKTLQDFFLCDENTNFNILEKMPTYKNSDGCVLLLDQKDNVIDEVYYKETMHSEFVKNKKGVSLERTDHNKNEWMSASEECGYATPGYKNSCFRNEQKKKVRLKTKTCNIRNNEEIEIFYNFRKGNYSATIKIFDKNGKFIKTLAKSILLSSSGIIKWNGKDDNERYLPTSLYIILFEAIEENGDIVKEKMVCVITNH